MLVAFGTLSPRTTGGALTIYFTDLSDSARELTRRVVAGGRVVLKSAAAPTG